MHQVFSTARRPVRTTPWPLLAGPTPKRLPSASGVRRLLTLMTYSLMMGLTMLNASTAFADDKSAESLKFFQELAETRSYSLGSPMRASATPDGKAVLFLQSDPKAPVLRLYSMDVASGQITELISPEAILKGTQEQLSPEELARRERMRMSLRGFTSYRLTPDGNAVLVTLSGKLYLVNRADKHITALPGEDWADPQISPDGTKVAAVSGNEVHVIEISTGKSHSVTQGATETLSHGLAEFVAQEEMSRFRGFWWSPDSTQLAFQETDESDVELLYIPDLARPEQPPQAHRYPRAGKTNARVRLGVVSVNGGSPTWIDWDTRAYPYLAKVLWEVKAAPLTILVQNREQQEQKLLAVNTTTGSTQVLLTEQDSAWLNIEDSELPHWMADGKSFLWASERRGAWALELRDNAGKLMKDVSDPAIGFRSLVHVDEKAGQAYLMASPDPVRNHVYRLNLKSGKAEALTLADGYHSAGFSKNGQVYIHSASLMDNTVTVEVCDTKGKVLHALPSKAVNPPSAPNLELTKVKVDEKRSMDVAIVRPRDFKSGQKYPVLLEVYAGPGTKTVMAIPRMFLKSQWLADHGYVVVHIDGRGTPGHGREWERAIRGNLIDVALQDQVDGLTALARQVPELDLSRVAVTGWSFGGYFTAMALLKRPDIFKVGVSGAPVTDWQDYDTHYTERYLGLPDKNPEAYSVSSALTFADKLSRPMLLIHGLADDNVYFVHTLKLANALFNAGKPYDLITLPGTHMLYEPRQTLMLWSRVVDYMNRALGLPVVYGAAGIQ